MMDHPNIVKLLDVIEDIPNQRTTLVLEYIEGVELLEFVLQRDRLNEVDARRIFRQIVSAVDYCHSMLVIHKDLKLENILIDVNNNIKLIDFGLATTMVRSFPFRYVDRICQSSNASEWSNFFFPSFFFSFHSL